MLIEGGNLQVYMYCVHAQKGTSGAPRTHFRALKSQHFLGAYPQTPLAPSILRGSTFRLCPGPRQSSWQPVTEFQNNASCSLSASVQTCPGFNHMGVNIWLGRKGTGKCIRSVANMCLGFKYLFNKWPQNTSVVHFYALNGLRAESCSVSILMRVNYDECEHQHSMLEECFQYYP